jgi:hypothetical protein
VDRLAIPLAAAIAIVVIAYRTAAARCREVPGRRPWLAVASVAAIGVAAMLVPWLFSKLDPPYSESPAGIFVYLWRLAVVGLLALGGLGTLIGVAAAGRGEDSDPAV